MKHFLEPRKKVPSIRSYQQGQISEKMQSTKIPRYLTLKVGYGKRIYIILYAEYGRR